MTHDLFQKIDELCELNERRVTQMRQAGVQYAENEAEYRKALRNAILEEQARGTRVTVIGDLCRGRPDVADLKLRRDCAESNWKAFQEEINTNKLRIRVLDAQLAREWGEAKGGV